MESLETYTWRKYSGNILPVISINTYYVPELTIGYIRGGFSGDSFKLDDGSIVKFDMTNIIKTIRENYNWPINTRTSVYTLTVEHLVGTGSTISELNERAVMLKLLIERNWKTWTQN